MSKKPNRLDAAWIELQKRFARWLTEHKEEVAISAFDEFLAKRLPKVLRREVLGSRAVAVERLGRVEEAYSTSLQAWEISEPGSYGRYGLELNLSRLCEMLHRSEETESWLRAALVTCLASPNTSGGVALKGYLKVRAVASLNDSEWELCRNVIQHSWSVLRVSGAPPPDLMEGAELLIKAAGQRRTKP